ncbi:hypothetical protein [Shewanella sp. SG41-3]|uniref:hypothetical protein n=1 Tax=Shewanella sp. SG41-3 TaxID=2760977 RepID=UPI0016049D2D|nr:hypothetical protein [Shewanella sp. SG41-3]MBB1475853.1 hypothetical protein [Shewanella sp. SG41-3]
MNIPKNVKLTRLNDIKKILLPEMVIEQLKLVDETFSEEIPNQLDRVKNSDFPGIEIVKLIGSRAHKVRASGDELYAERASEHQPSQLGLVVDNTVIFMKQSKALLHRVNATSKEHDPQLLLLIDRVIETAFYLGYYAGSNDSLALTDRYTNTGYITKVTQPQKGGQSKAKATDPLKKLVRDMASSIYENQRLSNTTKLILVEAINYLLADFSQKGDNNQIPSLIKFASRAPEPDTIKAWIKDIKKPNNLAKSPKSTLAEVKTALKSAYTTKKIEKLLNSI